jgi:hypothetical protein
MQRPTLVTGFGILKWREKIDSGGRAVNGQKEKRPDTTPASFPTTL